MSKKLKYALLNPFSGLMEWMMVPFGQIRYYKTFGRLMKLKNPMLFYDKVAWILRNGELNKMAELADKYAVRAYVSKLCGDDILTKLYGVYDSAADIDFDQLPNQFVAKTNNGCASNFLVRDKQTADLEAIRRELDFWMHIKYGKLTGQPHYTLIKPRIIAEQLLVEDGDPNRSLTDYKFNCFDGYVHSCAAFRDRVQGTHEFARMVYDTDWNHHPEWTVPGKQHLGETPRPRCLEQMIDIAQRLSKGFPFVRVDLYNIDDKPYFGELTFAPGLTNYTTEFQRMLGDMIDLSKVKRRR